MTNRRHGAAAPRLSSRQEGGVLIAAGLAMLVAAFKAPLWIFATRGGDAAWASLKDWSYYNVSFLSASYFNVGFARRALGGTLSRLFSADPYRGSFLFYGASAVFLMVPLILWTRLLLRRTNPRFAVFMIFFAAISPQMFLGWANDIGRTDLFAIGTIAWAAWFLQARHGWMAGAMLVIGFLAHETAIIFGLPMLVAMMAQVHGGYVKPVIVRSVVAIAAVVIAIAAVQGFLAPDMTTFGRTMLASTPPPLDPWHADLRDCAIYMMITGMRGLQTAVCYNVYWSGYLLVAVFAIIVTVLNGAALGLERHWLAFLAAVMMPLILMILIANDTGRWVKFACANAWLLSAFCMAQKANAPLPRRLALNACLLAGLLFLGSSPVHETNRINVSVLRRLGLPPAPQVADWMTRCDPEWRSLVYHH